MVVNRPTGNKGGWACIASKEAAEIYGLQIYNQISTSAPNATRYIIIKKENTTNKVIIHHIHTFINISILLTYTYIHTYIIHIYSYTLLLIIYLRTNLLLLSLCERTNVISNHLLAHSLYSRTNSFVRGSLTCYSSPMRTN